MSARISRTAAVVVATLLGLGAVVAVFSSDDDGGDDSSASPAATAAPAAEAPAANALREETEAYDASSTSRASEQDAAGDEMASGGFSSGGSDGAGESVAAPAPDAAGSPALPPIGPDAGSLGGAPIPAAVPPATTPGRIIKTAVLTVDVPKDKLKSSFDRVVIAAAAVGGWVQSAEEGDDQATLTLKVPAEKLEQVLTQIAEVGKRKSQSIAGEDVGAEYVDLEGRLRHWRAQEAVFLQLMTQAKTIPDTIQIQQQLSSIQSQIEQIEGRRRFLDGQTAYSTVRLTLLKAGAVVETKAGADDQSTLAEAWEDATGAALAVLGGTLVVLGVAVPLGLIVGLPGLLFLSYRRRQQRTRPGVLPAG